MNWAEFANVAAAVGLSSALNGLWLGLLVAGLAAAVLRAMPHSNATTRYAIWFTALLLVVAMPIVLLLVPRQAPAASVAVTMGVPAPVNVPVAATWPVCAGAAWLGITMIMLARAGWSMWHILSLKSGGTEIGRRGHIRLLASPDVRVPMAAGFFRRAIIFPEWLVDQLSPEEFDQVLCHELAHLRRGDDWTQLAQALAEAVLFFNPAVYLIGRRLKIEREIACDDWVVSTTGRARPYAACLTHLHELTRRASAPQLAPGATTRTRWQISARVEALLQTNRNATPRFAGSGWLAAGTMVAAALIVAAEVPPLAGVQELPVAAMPVVQLQAPGAPAMAVAPHRAAPAAPVRRRLLARSLRKPAAAQVPLLEPDPGYMLVRAWNVEQSPGYVIITVVFFAPPPPMMFNRI